MQTPMYYCDYLIYDVIYVYYDDKLKISKTKLMEATMKKKKRRRKTK